MQLLVRVVDKINQDPVLNEQLTKKGDVIAFKEDGKEWGIMELKNPEWRIIHVPNMTLEQAIALTDNEVKDGSIEGQILRKRGMKLDLDKIDALEEQKILATKNVSRKTNVKTDAVDAQVRLSSVLSNMITKEPISSNDKIIGKSDVVIGK